MLLFIVLDFCTSIIYEASDRVSDYGRESCTNWRSVHVCTVCIIIAVLSLRRYGQRTV